MTSGMHPHPPESGVGRRLRDAREAAGLSVADVGRQLKMPVRIVESLEAEDWARLGAPVFVRGQLRSYARLLGLPVDMVLQFPESAPVVAADLQPRSYTPKMQHFAEQASRRAVYIVLTLAIMVPVWFATQSDPAGLAGESTPLDTPAGAGVSTPVADKPAAPVRASLAPLPSRPAAAALALAFQDDSWVEIVGSDGQVIESGLLKAGDSRQYKAGQVARIKLGNASTVRVEHEGQVQDLTPFIRSNVARFTVSSDGSIAPQAQ